MIEGMRVLALSHFVQGPAASQYLADLGADVVKVEPPAGSWERRAGSAGIRVAGHSVTHLSVNRNKRSLAVDLKHPDAQAVLRPLIERADVLMENYRGGALDRLGFGYDAVRAIKPDIVYASATGWGSRGPMAGRPGVDLLVQAELAKSKSEARRFIQGGGVRIDDAKVTDIAATLDRPAVIWRGKKKATRVLAE